MRLKHIFLFSLFFTALSADAQEVSFKDSIAKYNSKRIKINRTGMNVLGAWGIANIADGGIGYFTAKQDEWKYFHEMNALWGVVNTGIAAMGIMGTRKEMARKLDYLKAYDRYKATKRLYLLNAGLDVLYIGTGIGLAKYGATTKNNPALFTGFGRSITLQGAFLLIFDNFMYSAHARYNSKWYQLMDEISVSNTGVGIRHSFK